MTYFVFRNTTIERFLDNLSATYSGYDDISIIDKSAQRYLWLYTAPTSVNAIKCANQIDHYGQMLEMVLGKMESHKQMIAFTMVDICDFANRINSPIRNAVITYNSTLFELSDKYPNLKVLDLSEFLSQYPRSQWFDWKYYLISQIAINPRLANDFQLWLEKQIDRIEFRRKKCLVLDLDNTLWGGVVGEDGVEGVALGEDYPGNAYLLFQQSIIEMSQGGVILTVCSKNNYQDVANLWKTHPSNIIREEHLSACRINWQDKAQNISELAEELNVGLDSMVFIDDNPTERELIKGMLPMVEAPDFPQQPYLLPKFAKEINDKYFKLYDFTREDFDKTEQYRSNASRNRQQSLFDNFGDYIKSLEIELSINSISPLTITRAAQMTQKTNQFNLTTRRYSESDIQTIIDDGGYGYTVAVKDKFGDSGITGLILIDRHGYIDTFLMSCRVLGKKIEEAFIRAVILDIYSEKRFTKLYGTYLKTEKNGVVSDFYSKLGFIDLSDGHYELELGDLNPNDNHIYKISFTK